MSYSNYFSITSYDIINIIFILDEQKLNPKNLTQERECVMCSQNKFQNIKRCVIFSIQSDFRPTSSKPNPYSSNAASVHTFYPFNRYTPSPFHLLFASELNLSAMLFLLQPSRTSSLLTSLINNHGGTTHP